MLDEARVRQVLRRSRITQVATLSPKNRPFMTPLWFLEHLGLLYSTTGPGTRAGRSIAVHPEITLLSQDVANEPRARATRVMKPALAAIATVCGMPGSFQYSAEGAWRGR